MASGSRSEAKSQSIYHSVRRQLAVHPRQVEDSRDGPHLIIFRNDLLEIEAIEKLPLVPIQPPHHRSLPPMSASQRPNHCSSKNSNDFCNKIGRKRTCERAHPDAPWLRVCGLYNEHKRNRSNDGRNGRFTQTSIYAHNAQMIVVSVNVAVAYGSRPRSFRHEYRVTIQD